MAVGSGLSSTLGIATETTVGTPVAVTRFVEFDSETMAAKKTVAQGQGNRGAGFAARRSARRNYVARQAGGDVKFGIPTSGFGLWLQHMFGSFATTPTSLGGGLFQQVHNLASVQGKAFTLQVIRPDTNGNVIANAFTYPGSKITGWEIDATEGQQITVDLTIDSLDEATPSNGFANTTLSTASTVGAVSISTVATIPVGSYITIGAGTPVAEVVVSGAVTGAGPFAVTVPALTYAHPIASTVGSATGVNYGAATALQAASYTAANTEWDFSEGTLLGGGVTSVVSGVWTQTSGVNLGVVRAFNLKLNRPMKTDRWPMGSQIRVEQLENDWPDITGTASLEYSNRTYYDIYAADAALALVLKFVARNGAILQFFLPVAFQEDGAGPQVGGPDILIPGLAFTGLDDGVNGSIQAVLTNTDAAV